jgi:N-acetylmuramoyl-L-alanine amidase
MSLAKVIAALGLAVALSLGYARPAGGFAALDNPSHCLALALYWEARTEGRDGMLAVASVVLNRVAHPEFPSTVCAVVKQGGESPPCQFSWWCDGMSDRPTEPRPWALAQRIAKEALTRPPRDATRGALFFHSIDLETPWVKKRQRTARIGRHVFHR